MIYVGVDTGGTFTDFVVWQDGQVRTHKTLSTPDAPERAIIDGLETLKLHQQPIVVIHGSTVATNAVLESKGVKTAYITNKGFRDVLTIGRQARDELYNLQPKQKSPPVPTEYCLEVDCRLSADGQWLTELNDEKLEKLINQLKELQVSAVAINLLFSYVDASVEKQIGRALQQVDETLFVSLSADVLNEIGEYERGMATWLNAWVGPLIQGYVDRLQQSLKNASLAIMQSSGETMAASLAARQAVRMLLSGPAGGLVGARTVAALSGFKRLMTFDMGGTSSDVALLDNAIGLTRRGKLAGYPVAVPMVDMHTIGAGGGSIASLDEGGLLRVGPESAGATPGPVCYAQGGKLPTVTDANLILGRIPAQARLGGNMLLDRAAAEIAMQQLADAMGLSLHQAAEGIIAIANEHMARALRVISVQKGFDPADFVLISFGGAGGLHVCALAEELGMRKALVPVYAGVLSALGMLATAPGRQLSRSLLQTFAELNEADLVGQFTQLEQQGVESLQAEKVDLQSVTAGYSLDLRYKGQSNTLNVVWSSLDECEQAFHDLHKLRYGHQLSMPVEVASLRVSLTAEGLPISFDSVSQSDSAASAADYSGDIPVYQRQQLAIDEVLQGPLIIVEDVATTWVEKGWSCQCDQSGNLLLMKV